MNKRSKRSKLMGRIKGKDTNPETRLRRALWQRGLRYRLHASTPAGRPDLVFPRPEVAVYIDGCFWHGCPAHYVRPRSHSTFWAEKLRSNVERDRRQTLALEGLGWKVVRTWEHEIEESLEPTVDLIERLVRSGDVPGTKESWRVVEVEPLDPEGNVERRIMERLRDPDVRRVVKQKRSTKKWRKPTSEGLS